MLLHNHSRWTVRRQVWSLIPNIDQGMKPSDQMTSSWPGLLLWHRVWWCFVPSDVQNNSYKRSCGKVMFSVVCVCSQGGGCYVTITHDALVLTVQAGTRQPPPCIATPSPQPVPPSADLWWILKHYGWQAGSTHYAGMLSCLQLYLQLSSDVEMLHCRFSKEPKCYTLRYWSNL